MLKKPKQPKSINFLDSLSSPNDLAANAYIWLVQIGKYMLIFVQLIVLAVFISRFVVDRRNNDLTEEINNKVLLLSNENWRKNSILFGNYQNLLSDVAKIRETQEINSTKVSELVSGVPSSMEIESFSLNEGRVSFQISAYNLDTVNSYEAALKNNPDYYDVRVSISKDSSDIKVRVTFNLFETVAK